MVNRVHYQKLPFVLLENGKPVARLTPDEETVCTGRQLAATLAQANLPKDEAIAWSRDLRQAKKKLKLPADRWR